MFDCVIVSIQYSEFLPEGVSHYVDFLSNYGSADAMWLSCKASV